MSAKGDVWEVAIGVDDTYEITIYGEDNQPIAFEGTETLTMQCWQGDDLTGVSGLVTASWTGGTPASGVCVLSVVGSATTALTPDFYLLRLLVGYGGKTYTAWEGWLQLGDAPGLGTAPATYCTLQDVIDHAGEWIVGHMMDSGRTSFLAERSRARYEMDKIILAHARRGSMNSENMNRAGWADWAPEQPNAYIKGLLDNDQLIISHDIKSATAYLTIALVCERALTWGEDDVFAKRGTYYRRKAANQIATTVAEIDTTDPPDGVGDYVFNLGYMSFR